MQQYVQSHSLIAWGWIHYARHIHSVVGWRVVGWGWVGWGVVTQVTMRATGPETRACELPLGCWKTRFIKLFLDYTKWLKVPALACIQLLKAAVDQEGDQRPLGNQIYNVWCQSNADTYGHLVISEHACEYLRCRTVCKAAWPCWWSTVNSKKPPNQRNEKIMTVEEGDILRSKCINNHRITLLRSLH